MWSMPNTGDQQKVAMSMRMLRVENSCFLQVSVWSLFQSKALSDGTGTDSVGLDLGVGPRGWLSLALIHLLSLSTGLHCVCKRLFIFTCPLSICYTPGLVPDPGNQWEGSKNYCLCKVLREADAFQETKGREMAV